MNEGIATLKFVNAPSQISMRCNVISIPRPSYERGLIDPGEIDIEFDDILSDSRQRYLDEIFYSRNLELIEITFNDGDSRKYNVLISRYMRLSSATLKISGKPI